MSAQTDAVSKWKSGHIMTPAGEWIWCSGRLT